MFCLSGKYSQMLKLILYIQDVLNIEKIKPRTLLKKLNMYQLNEKQFEFYFKN